MNLGSVNHVNMCLLVRELKTVRESLLPRVSKYKVFAKVNIWVILEWITFSSNL